VLGWPRMPPPSRLNPGRASPAIGSSARGTAVRWRQSSARAKVGRRKCREAARGDDPIHSCAPLEVGMTPHLRLKSCQSPRSRCFPPEPRADERASGGLDHRIEPAGTCHRQTANLGKQQQEREGRRRGKGQGDDTGRARSDQHRRPALARSYVRRHYRKATRTSHRFSHRELPMRPAMPGRRRRRADLFRRSGPAIE
jgi:hypothetical protein